MSEAVAAIEKAATRQERERALKALRNVSSEPGCGLGLPQAELFQGSPTDDQDSSLP
jgi:hypothetical protein